MGPGAFDFRPIILSAIVLFFILIGSLLSVIFAVFGINGPWLLVGPLLGMVIGVVAAFILLRE